MKNEKYCKTIFRLPSFYGMKLYDEFYSEGDGIIISESSMKISLLLVYPNHFVGYVLPKHHGKQRVRMVHAV